jgi:HSP20 family molecular chaperone IbpA
MRIKFSRVDSLAEEVDRLQQRIATRALEIFRARGGSIGHALEDWLTAERETVWRPAIEVVRTKDAFVIQAAVAGVDPKRLDVRVTPTELWLGADVHHSDHQKEGDVLLCDFVNGPLLRTWKFPDPVDTARVSAECRNGMLTVIAPLAAAGRHIAVTAA